MQIQLKKKNNNSLIQLITPDFNAFMQFDV